MTYSSKVRPPNDKAQALRYLLLRNAWRIKNKIPQTLGTDLSTYGPFENEDVVILPMLNAYVSMRMIIAFVWAIYPLGYVFGYITNSVEDNLLNIIYNMADFINKIAFGLIIWAAAMQNTIPRSR